MTAAVPYRSRALTAFAVALPIPLIAAAGLSLPLPATVARLAAKLVPFGSSAAVHAGLNGSIVRAPREHKVTFTAGPRVTTAVARMVPRGVMPSSTRGSRPAATGQPGTQTVAAVGTDDLQQPQASSAAAPPSSAPEPAPAPTPIPATEAPPVPPPTTTTSPSPAQQVVDTVTTTENNTVSSVTNATNGVLGSVHP